MLKRILCDAFTPVYRDITFEAGLNTVLGDAIGSSAIGKTTFLDVIDYIFGGDHYYSTDIHKNVGPHTIRFQFEFDGESLYFYRETEHSNFVYRADENWHFREELEIPHYRRELAERYGTLYDRHGLESVIEHFFRIYGHGNTLEQLPLLSSTREKDDKAIGFLMRLFGKSLALDAVAERSRALGISIGSLQKKALQKEQDDEAILQRNLTEIAALNERYDKLMHDTEEYQFSYLGFDQELTEKMRDLRKKMQMLVSQRDQYQAQIDAIDGVQNNPLSQVTEEFTSLTRFFPDANIRALADIEHFHERIRSILTQEAKEQIDALQAQITRYNVEIDRMKKRIRDVGLTKEMAANAVGECVGMRVRIDHLTAENEEIQKRIDERQARITAEQELADLLQKQKEAISRVTESLNQTMRQLSDEITGGRETNPPVLAITEGKQIRFETPGNTSESSAYKGLIIYDLAIMRLCPRRLPMLIHDSNILSRVEGEYLAPILRQYESCGHQVFVAFENPEAISDEARELLYKHAKVKLGFEHGRELYGHSWSKRARKE